MLPISEFRITKTKLTLSVFWLHYSAEIIPEEDLSASVPRTFEEPRCAVAPESPVCCADDSKDAGKNVVMFRSTHMRICGNIFFRLFIVA